LSQQANGNVHAGLQEGGQNQQALAPSLLSAGQQQPQQSAEKNSHGSAMFGGAPVQPGNAISKTMAPGADQRSAAGKSQSNQQPINIQKQASGASFGVKNTGGPDPAGAMGQQQTGLMLGDQQPNAFTQYGMPVPGGQAYPFHQGMHPGMMAMPYPQYGLMMNPMAMHQMPGMSQHVAGKMMSSTENVQNNSS